MARALVIFGIVSACASCTLLIDTDGFRDEGAPADAGSADVSVESTTIVEGGGGDVDAGAPVCSGSFLICETFDGPAPLGLYADQKDPGMKIEIDTTKFTSPPGSALFDIPPSTNTSADTTLRMQTERVADFSVDAQLYIEYREPGISFGRYFGVGSGGNSLVLNRSGALREEGRNTTLFEFDELPLESWLPVHVELRLSKGPPTALVSVGKVTSGTITLADGWLAYDRPTFKFGISETNAPNKGWRVRWDDVVIRKL